jgi:hypothetical protein
LLGEFAGVRLSGIVVFGEPVIDLAEEVEALLPQRGEMLSVR